MTPSLGAELLSEIVGAAMLLLGGGVVATAIPTRSKGLGGGRLLIDFGRGPIPNKGTTCCCRR